MIDGAGAAVTAGAGGDGAGIDSADAVAGRDVTDAGDDETILPGSSSRRF